MGHDTGDAASEDLLASPQFVMDAAYTRCAVSGSRPPLPFHQSLEELRRYFDKFEVPLTLAMERFRESDELERGAEPYGWRDILMEEARHLARRIPDLHRLHAVPLWRMYGFPNGTRRRRRHRGPFECQAVTRAGSASPTRTSSRYCRTRFVNPNSDLIPKLEQLGVSFGVIRRSRTARMTAAALRRAAADRRRRARPRRIRRRHQGLGHRRRELRAHHGAHLADRSDRQRRSAATSTSGVARMPSRWPTRPTRRRD